VAEVRDAGRQLEVRVTREFGDAVRYATEAVSDGFDVVIAAGGDGTINEIASGMLSTESSFNTALTIVPHRNTLMYASATFSLMSRAVVTSSVCDAVTAAPAAIHG